MQHELQARGRIDRVDGREQHAGRADAGDADRPGERVDAIGVDAHQCGGGPVLRGGAHQLPGVRPAHEGEERRRRGEREDEGNGLREVQHRAADVQHRAVVGRAHKACLAAPENQGEVLQHDRKADGGEYLHVVRGVHDPPHDEGVAAPADDEEERDERPPA